MCASFDHSFHLHDVNLLVPFQSMDCLVGPPVAARIRRSTSMHCSAFLSSLKLQHNCPQSKKGWPTSIYTTSSSIRNCPCSWSKDRHGAYSQFVSRWRHCLAKSRPRGVQAFAHDSNKSDDHEEHFHEQQGVPSHSPQHTHQDDDSESNEQHGYVIKVSKELMGVFRYIEKAKREKIQEVAHTLRQCAGACLFFTIVRGILGPLVEVFKTTPPNWSKLILMLVSFDSFAICYLAMKASEPLDQLATLATESQPDIMGSIEKEEEMMLNLATELIKLFRRLRNIVISVAVSQFAQIMFAALKLTDPDFVANCSKIVGTWMLAPWV